jgi:uncharacterized iron-regulated membrane protein
MSVIPHNPPSPGGAPEAGTATAATAATAGTATAGTATAGTVEQTAPPRPPAPASPRGAAGSAARSGRSRSAVWALLVRMHFYAGVFVAPFLVVAAASGLAYAFTPQLDQLLYGDKLTVERVGEAVRPVAEQVRAARAAHPEGTLASVGLPAGPAETTRVVLDVEGLGEDRQRTVYVDPYTAEVRGDLTTLSGSTPVTTWIDGLHRDLNLGEPGRLYSELAASWLWVITLGGLVLWLGRRRVYRGGGPARQAVLPDLAAAKGVRRTRSLHATTGVWLVVGLLFLSATGLTWSTYAGERFSTALNALDARSPKLDATLPGAPAAAAGGGDHAGHGAPAGPATPGADPVGQVDQVLASARGAGLAGPLELTVPAGEHSGWTVAQTDNVWPVHRDQVAVDPASAQVTARNSWADYPVLAKISKLGIQAHMGVLFGLANQVFLAAVAIGLLCVIFWGYRMWWQRRPTRADRRALAGRPPARGTWRRLPRPVLLAGVPLTLAVAWALPVLGVSLALFLAADVLAGLLARRRRTRDLRPGIES